MPITVDELEGIVCKALDEFYVRRIKKLSTLRLRTTLRRKNPYLFRAIGTQDASELVEQILTAFMSSSDEGIFGSVFFEPVALAVSGGVVSGSDGADIVVESKASYKAIAVKSGTSVFNTQSRGKQEDNFKSLKSRLLKLQKHFDAVVGYAYGKRKSPEGSKSSFREISGQAFWAELTGDERCYLKILQAMKDRPSKHKQRYEEEWAKAKNRFTMEFTADFCKTSGEIDWELLLEFNSGMSEMPSPKDPKARGKAIKKKT